MVSDLKKIFVQELVSSIKEYPLVGIVNFQNLPAQQLQKMRSLLLKNEVKIVMARKKLLELALNESGQKNIEQLKERIKGMPALLFSKTNPFKLYKIIQKNKSEAPAKAGQIAPRDVVVAAGATNFVPGPIISEFAAVGIKTKVEDGKLAIIEDVVIVKEDEEISAKVAETLKRLDIKPMEVGLDLVAVWENGLVFEAKQLHLDEKEYVGKITTAAQWAMNLAIESAYTNKETTEVLLQKAFRDAKALALQQHILTDATKEEILSKVERQASALKAMTEVAIPEKKVETEEEAKEETEEEAKEEIEEEAKEETEEETEEEAKEEIEEEAKEEAKEETEEEAKEETEEEAKEETEEEAKEETEEEAKEETEEEAKVTINPTPEPLPTPITNQENDIPTAEELIKQTVDKFDKKNNSIASDNLVNENKKEKIIKENLSAENLVDEELKVAAKEQKASEVKKDTSVEEAEKLFEKLKKTGTLREE
jgi:large subunit ribosomal protein L10